MRTNSANPWKYTSLDSKDLPRDVVRGKAKEKASLVGRRVLEKVDPQVGLPSERLNQTLTSRDLRIASLKRGLVVR